MKQRHRNSYKQRDTLQWKSLGRSQESREEFTGKKKVEFVPDSLGGEPNSDTAPTQTVGGGPTLDELPSRSRLNRVRGLEPFTGPCLSCSRVSSRRLT